MRPIRLALPVFVAASLAGCACEDAPRTQTVSEEATVVVGNPAVDTAKPTVQQETPVEPEFKINVPRQCDFFAQNAVRKVDILWVVDNSGSMKSSQANLASEFPKFIQSLLSLQPPVDFHIGVTSTDVDNPELVYNADRDGTPPPDKAGTRGFLHGFDLGGGVSGKYIACDDKGACNVSSSNATAAFAQMSKVGTGGSAVERGLQAAYLALTNPANTKSEDSGSPDLSKKFPFIRPDASLFVVFVSDEDDASCAPYVPLNAAGRPVDASQLCTADPGCKCDATKLTWGSADYFVRFLESYKGFGHKELVAAGAVVCTEKETIGAQSGDPSFAHMGCQAQGPEVGPAYYGDRYIQVASATGGTAISIRGSFANALQSLGFAVSGLRKDFRLSRGPFTDSLEVYLTEYNAKKCAVDGDCAAGQKCRANSCATLKAVEARSLGSCTPSDAASPPALQYCKCDASVFRNILRFQSPPPAQSSIEVCYDVNSNLNQVCQ